MKPAYESVHASGQHSFLVRQFEEKGFSAPYHFHPEYELTFIASGSGKRYVGAHMHDFGPGDFVLLGANLPHCWKSGSAAETSSSIVVQFRKDFLGAGFFEKPEMEPLLQLLHKSDAGIRFTTGLDEYNRRMQELLHEQSDCKKTILLLDLLHELSLAAPVELLEKQRTHTNLSGAELERIHTVMAYIVEHFKTGVSLQTAASLAAMTPPAFCKYFKKITRKTLLEAVTDYRIDYAAQQLIHTDLSIARIAFNSGFNDLSHFHKTFRTRLHLSPLSYRHAFLKKLK